MTDKQSRPKEPWIAVTLSWIVSGLGLGYAGRWGLAAAFFLFSVALEIVVLGLALSGAKWWFLAACLLAVPWLSAKIGGMILAHRLTRRRNPPEFETQRRNCRDPFLAVFLSSIIPGLGHFYLRRWLLGILFVVGFIAVAIARERFSHPVILIVTFVLYLGAALVCLDAWRAGQKERRNSFRLAALVCAAIFVGEVGILGIAFDVRACAVEAFFIPTGGMAPQIVGRHFEYVCANCGYHYDVGCDESAMPSSLPIQAKPICPLCFCNEVTNPKAVLQSGDRLLALKYYYHFHPVERWDEIVFKYPKDPKTNYIKRVVGLPGETVEIRSGDVYINGQIAHKPDRVQEAFWLPVYDSAYPDRGRDDQPRWHINRAEHVEGSTESMPLTITPSGNPLGGKSGMILFGQRDADNRPAPITDFYGYDAWTSYGPPGRQDGQNVVTDLDLRATVELKGPGTLTLSLCSGSDLFRASLPTAGCGKAKLFKDFYTGCYDSIHEIARGPEAVLPIGIPVQVELANVDHKIILKVNGRRIFKPTGQGQLNEDDDFSYESAIPLENVKNRSFAEIDVLDATMVIHRLQINRDIYYTIPQQPEGVKAAEGHPYTLKADEFFVLGDNSPRSSDSRYWGPVPRANILGKAHVIYWPPSRDKPIE